MAPKSSSKDTRSLEFSDGSSNKFWSIELDGSSHTVTFGRIGTSGQTQTKDFDSDDAARTAFEKLVAEKLRKGYVDAGGSSQTSKSATTKSAASGQTSKVTTPPNIAGTSATARKSAKKSATSAATSDDAAVTTATPAATEAEIDLNTTREFDLQPADWYRAPFRTQTPMERGTPAPFDKDNCVRRVAKLKTTTYGWDVRWSDLQLPSAMTAPEAHFWLVVMTEDRGRLPNLKAFAESLQQKSFDGKLKFDTVRKLIQKAGRGVPKEIAIPLTNLFSQDEYVELIFDRSKGSTREPWKDSDLLHTLLSGFARYIVPWLTVAQRDSIRRRIRKTWDPHKQTGSDYECFAEEYYMAAAVGMPDEVYAVTSQWADDRYQKTDWGDHYQRPQDLVLGLGSAELIAAEWRRLKLRMRSADDVRAFLACTETSALDCVVDSILAETNKEKCEDLLSALLLVRAPEAAESVLQCRLSAKTPARARDWLDRNVGRAIQGLIDTAGGQGKLADSAIEYLRGVKRKGYESLISAAIRKSKNAKAAARVQSEVVDYEDRIYDPFDNRSTPKWLAKEITAVGSVKPRPLPGWAAAATLPPVIVGDERLNDDQIGLVLQLLVSTPVTEKHPLFTVLRENVSKSVRDDFAWKLFQNWQDDGCPAKEKWAMGAIAHLGDDGCVLKLTPLIRNWPGESQHARAVYGLECFRAIGSTTALMQLAGIAQKLKFKGLKSKAEQFVAEIAKERGLTREELEDRVVPDCGLDEQGRREFSFGTRTFSFVLGGDLKPMVRDENGKLRPGLPDPGAKDDAATAAESVAEWKLMKKQIRDVATIQAGRLEQAMVTGRRWKTDDFHTLLVQHPLMTHLVQKLIWGGYDAKGKRTVTFRVTEERDFADPEDNSVKLTGVVDVGVVHPLDLTDAERARWGEVSGDYEIVSPFPQLGRAVYSLEPGEEKTDDVKRFHGLKLVAPTLVFTLEKLGWIRGTPMDGGCFDEHSRQFPAADVTAVIEYEGTVGMGYIDPNEMLKLESIHFSSGMRPPSGYGWGTKKKLKLKDVPAVVLSEVLADLQLLKSKAK